jgi:hypothetical protein
MAGFAPRLVESTDAAGQIGGARSNPASGAAFWLALWRIRQFDTISGCWSNPPRQQVESEAVECAWLNPRLPLNKEKDFKKGRHCVV